MSEGDLINIGRQTVMTALTISAPFLVISLVIGLIISVFQAATQIHEQNIIFVPKIVAAALILIFFGSWIIRTMSGFTNNLFAIIANVS